MSLMVVDRVEQSERLQSLSEAFKLESVRQVETKAEHEKRINRFLDGINDRKTFLRTRAEGLILLLPKIEELSWFSNPDHKVLTAIKGIIDTMHTLHRLMVSNYIEDNRFFTRNGVGKAELIAYKTAADDLKELAIDLNDRFFVLPEDGEFQDLTHTLEGL